MKKFSVRGLMSDAWDLYKKNWVFLTLFAIGSGVVTGILGELYQNSFNYSSLLGLVVYIIYVVALIIISLVIVKVLFMVVDHKEPTFKGMSITASEVFRLIKVSLWKLLYTLLYMALAMVPGLLVLALNYFFDGLSLGFIGMILVGIGAFIGMIYTSIRYMFTTYVTVDHPEISSSHALVRTSSNLVAHHYGSMIRFIVLSCAVTILGFICLVVGLIPAFIVIAITKTLIYRKLSGASHEKGAHAEA